MPNERTPWTGPARQRFIDLGYNEDAINSLEDHEARRILQEDIRASNGHAPEAIVPPTKPLPPEIAQSIASTPNTIVEKAPEPEAPRSKGTDELPIADPAAARIAHKAIVAVRLGKADWLQVLSAASRQLDPITQGDALDYLSDVAINSIGLDPDGVQRALAHGQELRQKDRERGGPQSKSDHGADAQDAVATGNEAVGLEDFYAYMPMHSYI
jgi:hypothetical protein